jgi:acetate kinase
VRVLVVNAGSSSLKLRVLDSSDKVTGTADLPAPGGAADAAAMESALASLGDADAVGYRIVHGGTLFTAPVRIDDGVLARLRALTDLAPLHQPKSLAAVAAVQRVLPGVPGVACFDTAFHATIPAAAATYALPREWRQRWTLRRYGFHGLSHSYAARRAAELAGGGRTVTCHLGAGASLAAVRDGVSVDTTMGFTPLEGLVMATRSGSVDPGLVLWLADHAGTPIAELAATLEHRSGLLGLAGTADMQEVVAGAAAGLPDARLALDVYTHRLRAGIAAMAAALGGLDVLVFTGGVGENSPVVRSQAAAGLGFLGVRLDAGHNEADGYAVGDPAGEHPATGHPADGGPAAGDPAAGSSAADREIGDPGAPVRSFVIAAREDIEIAGQVRAVLATHER